MFLGGEAPLAHGGNGDAAPPAADPAPRTPPPLSGNPLDGVPLAGARILVVDDDMRSLYSLSSALERMGAETLSAPGGAQALDVLRADANVHLVFMDVAMPGMDGLQAIREIRLDPALRRTPVVALTAKTAKEDRDACLAAGANDYLPKPVDVDRLVLVANTWMRK